MTSLLEVKNLSIDFQLRNGVFHAVKDVSFSVLPGQIMGLAGESGSGKTTVGLALLKLLHENGRVKSGEVLFNDKNLLALNPRDMRDVRWKQVSMVFQGAMNAFNPVQKMGEQLMDVLIYRQKMKRSDALARVKYLLNELGIDEARMAHYPHEFSGGMKQRAMVAMALVCNPKLVIADEPTTAIDVMTKAQMLSLLGSLRDKFGLSMVIISHDLAALAEVCDTVAVMNHGELVEYGTVEQIFFEPRHPYTQHLIETIPRLDGPSQLHDGGQVVRETFDDGNDIGCVFAGSCPISQEQCVSIKPHNQRIDGGSRIVKCHIYNEPTDVLVPTVRERKHPHD